MKKRKISNWKSMGILFTTLFLVALVSLVIIVVIKNNTDLEIIPANNGQIINISSTASIKNNITSTNIITPTVGSNTSSSSSITSTPGKLNTNSPTPINDPSTGGELSNGSNSWYYMASHSLFTDTKPTTNAVMLKLVNKYRGIWQQDTSEKVVYFTMDTGEDCISNLNKILNVAKDKQVPITFFLTGTFIKAFPEMVVRMTNEGHIVANHTYNHPNLPNYLTQKGEVAFKKQITDVEDEYRKATGQEMIKILRPPEGAFSEKVFDITSKMGYRLGFWSFAYKDWISGEQPTYDDGLNKVVGQAHPGAVILLHPKSTTNTAIFAEVIDKLKARGYSFKGLDVFPG